MQGANNTTSTPTAKSGGQASGQNWSADMNKQWSDIQKWATGADAKPGQSQTSQSNQSGSWGAQQTSSATKQNGSWGGQQQQPQQHSNQQQNNWGGQQRSSQQNNSTWSGGNSTGNNWSGGGGGGTSNSQTYQQNQWGQGQNQSQHQSKGKGGKDQGKGKGKGGGGGGAMQKHQNDEMTFAQFMDKSGIAVKDSAPMSSGSNEGHKRKWDGGGDSWDKRARTGDDNKWGHRLSDQSSGKGADKGGKSKGKGKSGDKGGKGNRSDKGGDKGGKGQGKGKGGKSSFNDSSSLDRSREKAKERLAQVRADRDAKRKAEDEKKRALLEEKKAQTEARRVEFQKKLAEKKAQREKEQAEREAKKAEEEAKKEEERQAAIAEAEKVKDECMKEITEHFEAAVKGVAEAIKVESELPPREEVTKDTPPAELVSKLEDIKAATQPAHDAIQAATDLIIECRRHIFAALKECKSKDGNPILPPIAELKNLLQGKTTEIGKKAQELKASKSKVDQRDNAAAGPLRTITAQFKQRLTQAKIKIPTAPPSDEKKWTDEVEALTDLLAICVDDKDQQVAHAAELTGLLQDMIENNRKKEEALKRAEEQRRQKEESAKLSFEKYDVDKDGMLNAEEVRTYGKEEWNLELEDDQLKRIITSCDMRKKGGVTQDKFNHLKMKLAATRDMQVATQKRAEAARLMQEKIDEATKMIEEAKGTFEEKKATIDQSISDESADLDHWQAVGEDFAGVFTNWGTVEIFCKEHKIDDDAIKAAVSEMAVKYKQLNNKVRGRVQMMKTKRVVAEKNATSALEKAWAKFNESSVENLDENATALQAAIDALAVFKDEEWKENETKDLEAIRPNLVFAIIKVAMTDWFRTENMKKADAEAILTDGSPADLLGKVPALESLSQKLKEGTTGCEELITSEWILSVFSLRYVCVRGTVMHNNLAFKDKKNPSKVICKIVHNDELDGLSCTFFFF